MGRRAVDCALENGAAGCGGGKGRVTGVHGLSLCDVTFETTPEGNVYKR